MDSHRKSLIKAISWRIVGTAATFITTFILTREMHLAVALSGIDLISKIFLFYMHERMWNRIKI